MIRFGPCGIPLSCKGRTQKDGIEDVHTLGLNAMEVQFVRVNLAERFATEEDYGRLAEEIPGELIVDITRKGSKEKQKPPVRQMRIEKGDVIHSLNCGIAKDYQMLREIGELARDLDIQLSLHAPYYMDILGPTERSDRSMDNLRLAGLVAQGLGATVLATNIGLYDALSREQGLEVLVKRIKELQEWFKRQKIVLAVGLEVAGKQQVCGPLEDIIAVCKRLTGVIPVINFAHHHSRESGVLKRPEDFKELFDGVAAALKSDTFYTHFSGVEHEGGNEKRYTPIKKGDLRFEPLAEYLLETEYAVTIASDSPLLEHDAMYMKVILERVQLKRELREAKKDMPPDQIEAAATGVSPHAAATTRPGTSRPATATPVVTPAIRPPPAVTATGAKGAGKKPAGAAKLPPKAAPKKAVPPKKPAQKPKPKAKAKRPAPKTIRPAAKGKKR